MEEEFIDESFFSGEAAEEKDIDVKKTGLENSFTERQVGSIAVAIEPVSINAMLDVVIDMFKNQEDLGAIPIEENDQVIGVIERETIQDATSSAFKRLVAKSLGEYVKRSPFNLNTSDYLEKISAKVNETAIAVEVKYFVVLLHNRSFYGLVSVAEINKKIEELRAHDLEKAKAIQQNILQKNSVTKDFPFGVHIYNRMANPVGGDFYLAENLSDNKYVIGSFDVSGKNVSAALLTVTIGSFFTFFQMTKASISAVKLVMMLDKYLAEIVPLGNFITGSICFVDKNENSIQIFNCGHTDSILVIDDKGSKKTAILHPELPPFGMGSITDELKNKDKSYYKLKVMDGLQINLYSDGLGDMQNEEGKRFGDTKIKEFLLDLYDSENPEKMIEEKCSEWTNKTLLPDDISVINIRF